MPARAPALKNELMLPAVLDPWASHALYEAANLAKNAPGSKVWLVSLGPKAKLQQVMMTVAQKVPFELVALDGPAERLHRFAAKSPPLLAAAIQAIPGLDRSRLLLFGGWESASRGAGATLQMVGERLGIVDQFQGVDQMTFSADGSFEILERIEGGKHQVSRMRRNACRARLGHGQSAGAAQQSAGRHGEHAHRDAGAATRQTGKAWRAKVSRIAKVALPKQQRTTRIVKDVPADEIAKEIVAWIKQE